MSAMPGHHGKSRLRDHFRILWLGKAQGRDGQASRCSSVPFSTSQHISASSPWIVSKLWKYPLKTHLYTKVYVTQVVS